MSTDIQHSTFNIQHSRLPFLLIAIVALLVFSNLLLRHEVPTFRDHSDYFQPLRWFTAEELRHGRLPLWNPYSASGEPWLANPQTGVFYPPAWIFVVLPFSVAYVLFLALHLMLAGCGAFLLFRRFASSGAALAAALALMLSGPTMSLVDVNNNLATFAWLPLVLWCAVAGVAPQRSALVIALSFLAGEPFFAAAGALAFALIRRRDIINVALTAAALSAVQLLPFLDWVRDSDRAGVATRQHMMWESMPLHDWLAVLSPVTIETSQHFIPVAYAGLLTALLAAVGLVVQRSRAVTRICAAVIVLCMIVAAGAYFAPTRALLSHLPLMIFRYPSRVVPLAAVAICALAAMGFDRAVRPRWAMAVAALMCADPLMRSLSLLDEHARFDPHQIPYARAVGRDAKIARSGLTRNRVIDRHAWIAGYINLLERRFDAWTAAPLTSADYAAAYDAAMSRTSSAEVSAMSIGYILTERDGKVGFYHNRAALPMAYVRADDGRIAPASWSAFTTSALYVGVDAPFDGTLVVTQQHARGWRATVDGADAETFRRGVFRALRVARGHHEIAWRYRPAPLVIGAIITLLAIVRLLLSSVFVKGRAHENFFRVSFKIA